MNHIERFIATIERKPVDRPASWLGLPAPSAYTGLLDFFNINNIDKMTYAVDDDVYPIELPYNSPTSNAIYAAFDFAKDFEGNNEDRTLTAAGFFEDYSDPSKIDDFDWPDPKKYIDPLLCRKAVDDAPEGKAIMGVLWSAHFQDACAAFGMEEALMKMIIEPEMFQAVIDRILDFYLEANEIFYTATEGKIHAVLIGNDLGSQTGLMLSPELIRNVVLPGTKKLIDQAHRYGLKVIHHSCGAIRDIIGDLIDVGCDAIHPIQALASGMEPDELKKDFGEKVTFCGGVDAQFLLVNGNEDDVSRKVNELKQIFPTGLIVSPSHEAVLPDIPPANIKALFQSVH
jgi:uroporphyrinogen decarboxylase